MRKLTVLILSMLLFPGIAFAQSYDPPPPPPDAQGIETARPPDAEPDLQPPAPPSAPPARAQVSDDDAVGLLQQPAPAPAQLTAPRQSGQWVYTSEYGWVWMPYGQQYVDEGAYGADSPYQYVYCVRLGWSWVAAPWLWGWGVYPYFGVVGPSHFAWYRGLYRSGYGWGRYRGGSPRGSYSHGYRYPAYPARGAQAPRPIARGPVSRGYARPYATARPAGSRGGPVPGAMGSFHRGAGVRHR